MSSINPLSCTGSPFCEDGQVCKCEAYEQHEAKLKDETQTMVENQIHQLNVIHKGLK